MKKILFPGVFLALLLATSCSKDEFTEEDATNAQKEIISYQDSIDHVRDSLFFRKSARLLFSRSPHEYSFDDSI